MNKKDKSIDPPETEFLEITEKIFKLLFKLDEKSFSKKKHFFKALLLNTHQQDTPLEDMWNTKIQFKKEFGSKAPNIEFPGDSTSEITLTFYLGTTSNSIKKTFYLLLKRPRRLTLTRRKRGTEEIALDLGTPQTRNYNSRVGFLGFVFGVSRVQRVLDRERGVSSL